MTSDDARERSVSSTVEVNVDPETAFHAFTEEMDLWWVRGPINFHAAGRAVEMRFEPGVGGRVLEVYDDAGGEALELARVVEWEPPKLIRLASSLDDVETEVSFEPVATGGTLVQVVATIAAGGADNGGTAWVRVVPPWFGGWATRRGDASRVVRDIARLGLTVRYRSPSVAARWLRDVFGFVPIMALPEDDSIVDYSHVWMEFRIGDSSLVVEPLEDEPRTGGVHEDVPRGDAGSRAQMPWVYVDELEEHYRRVQEAGTAIVELPLYVVEDVEGYRWTFAQARPTMGRA